MSETEKDKKKKLTFISFSKTNKRLLQEVNRRQMQELNAALMEIYDEMPEVDTEATDVQYVLRQDLSGVDVKPLIVPDPSDSKGENKNNGKTD